MKKTKENLTLTLRAETPPEFELNRSFSVFLKM
jgi:hypothetical protein